MRSIHFSQSGFTLIEVLTTGSLVLFILIFIMPGYLRATDSAKESETRANLHEIQVAVERYMTDNDTYPWFLLGGDQSGWLNWHDIWDGVNDIDMRGDLVAGNDKVFDALIEFEYISSYPANPFVDDGSSVIFRTSLEGLSTEGAGDPRFGFSGNIMGMGLDDMNYFKGAIHPGAFTWTEIETRRTLDRGDWMIVPDEFIDRNTNMYYLFGGHRPNFMTADQEVVYRFWPGNFFYKAAPDTVMGNRHLWTASIPNTCQVGGPRQRYILGCYGAEGVQGLDVIRLSEFVPDGQRVYWRTSPPYSEGSFECGFGDFTGGFGSQGGLPEVFGGGDEFTGPWWFYNESGRNSGDFIYGAPDGIPDGIILVLTDGNNVWEEVD